MIKVSQPFIAPKAPAILYRSDLYKLIKQMIKDYKSVLTIYKEKEHQVALDATNTWLTTEIMAKMDKLGAKWAKRFEEYANAHSKKYVMRLLKMSNLQIKAVMKNWYAAERLELFGEVIPTDIQQVVKANIAYNISLVSSIAPQYHERIYGAVLRSISGNGSVKQLTNEIYRYGNMSMHRAKLIATDQTNKIYESITLHNCKRLGIKRMKWLHSHAVKEPRELHIRKWDGVSSPQNPNGLDGLIFELDNPPLIQEAKGNKPAVYGYPKQLIGCNCVMCAVLE